MFGDAGDFNKDLSKLDVIGINFSKMFAHNEGFNKILAIGMLVMELILAICLWMQIHLIKI